MPVLSNPKHELFAQELASGKTADEAYQNAGYAPNDGNCIRLKGNERVAARVSELQGAIADAVVEATAIDRTVILRELGKIGLAGLNDEHVSPNVKRAALVDYAKIEGWMIERSEVGKPGDFSEMPDDELQREIRARAEKLGLPAPSAKLN